MSRYLVTQSEYTAVMSNNPSWFVGDPNLPVETVEWQEATTYCARLTERERAASRLPTNWAYRLPTESEWEYACRAGTVTPFYMGNALRGGMVNFWSRYEYDGSNGSVYVANPVGYVGATTVVGAYPPNPWGLYDMCGNELEWCSDWYGSYPTGTVTDPQGPVAGSEHVFRGGSWGGMGQYCRSAYRCWHYPLLGDAGDWLPGFRVVLAPNSSVP